jgi:hypothetical protein
LPLKNVLAQALFALFTNSTLKRWVPGTGPCLAVEAECWDAGCWDNPNTNDDALLPLKKKRRSYRPRPANKALGKQKKGKKPALDVVTDT